MEDDLATTIPTMDRLSIKESAVIHPPESETRPKKRWLCNELVREFCHSIPAENTSDQILLASFNIYSYLGSKFRGKRLIYEGAIAFIKCMLNNNNKQIIICIDQVSQHNQSRNIVIYWEQTEKAFEMKTTQFRVRISLIDNPCAPVSCWIDDGGSGNDHLCYFLRLIKPLIKPIMLDLTSQHYSHKPHEKSVHFLNTYSKFIDVIGLDAEQLDSPQICEALAKFNKLNICGPIHPRDVPRFIHWLTTTSSKGQTKKCDLLQWCTSNGPSVLFDKIREDFVRATSKSPFVVRLECENSLTEFSLRNEVTGEKLQLRCTNVENGESLYALSRSPVEELDLDNQKENDDLNLKNWFTRIFWH